MADQLYGRTCQIVIAGFDGAGLDFSQMSCRFYIQRGDAQTPNMCELRIFNLSAETLSQIGAEYTNITISAGYQGKNGLLFQGSITQKRWGRENGKNTYLDITASDGDEAYQYTYVSQPMAANQGSSDVAKVLFDAMERNGVNLKYAPQFPEKSYVRGKAIYGLARDELRKFTNQERCVWSIDNGKLVVIPLNSYIPGDAVVLDSTTGLIGTPEQTQLGIRMRTLLNSQLSIGRLVQLKNTAVNQLGYGVDPQSIALRVSSIEPQNHLDGNGYYYVMQANHTGETRGRSWYTELTCMAVDATVIDANPIMALSVLTPFTDKTADATPTAVQLPLGGP